MRCALFELFDHQATILAKTRKAWDEGHQNVLLRADTGIGKTVMLSDEVRRRGNLPSCTFAHRQELVGQLSLSLARQGVQHNVIAPEKVVRAISANHVRKVGRSFFVPNAPAAVAGVDTLIRRPVTAWDRSVRLWTADEAHHVLRANKWGTATERFTHPQCQGLGPTATPQRADGHGLGRHASGLFDVMVEGPPMRWAIDNGYLTPYRIVLPETDLAKIDIGDVSAGGDWSSQKLRDASVKSRIVGNVVEEYRKRAAGMLTVVFATDVDTAEEMAANFRAAGVPASSITGEMHDSARWQVIEDFEARRLQVLVAVDIISEGFDLPAVECAIFCRPTMSLALYMQQFGRALRVMAGKLEALIIDMAGNFKNFGPPDRPRQWTLDGADRKSGTRNYVEPTYTCSSDSCAQPYEKWRTECPHCGALPPPPADRSSPMVVAGDLVELDPATLAAMLGDVGRAEMSAAEFAQDLHARRVPLIGHSRQLSHHLAKQAAREPLRAAMELWGGARLADGLNDREMQKLFFHRFGVDVITARTLPVAETESLTIKIYEEFANADAAL